MAYGEEIWALTAYFNPAGYKSRLANYRVFRRRLDVPLVAVELGYGPAFELGPGDAEVLIQLRCPDVLWQKERLLNVGLAALPESVEKVAWLDGDVFFPRRDWAARASALLDAYPLIHLYSRRLNLLPGGEDAAPDDATSAVSSIFDWTRSGEIPTSLGNGDAPLRQGTTVGLAWAARRDLLRRHGFFDTAILGSGDRVMANTAFGRFDLAARTIRMNDVQREQYLEWARPFHEEAAGRVGCVDQPIKHLWHGSLVRRAYVGRYEKLKKFDLNPAADLRIDDAGCWRWTSDKPEMHAYVRDYFGTRLEDD